MQKSARVELDFVRATFCGVEDFEGFVVHARPPFADSPLINSVALDGKVAIIKRGLSTISDKARAAAAAGAIGVIIVNWADRLDEFGSAEENNPPIPVVCVKQQDALDHLKDGAYVAFSGASRISARQTEPAGESTVDDDDTQGSSVYGQVAMGSQGGGLFDGFLDMGDAMVLASLGDDGILDCSEEDMVPDADRIRGILSTSYGSIKDFDHAIETFDQCMRSWQERLSILGKVGSSDAVLDAHFKHLSTARQLRNVLAQVEEYNRECEKLMQNGDYLSVISDLTGSLRRLQETEASLRGRDELRISLLDSPQRSYALLQLALIQTEQYEQALTVCVQAKARSLSHILGQMDQSLTQQAELSVGTAVRIHGLQNDLHHEGRIGTVEQVGEVMLVDVGGEELRVRRQNLQPAFFPGDNETNHRAWHGYQGYLPDMEFGEVQRLVQAQECLVVEYFLFSEQSLGIWLIDSCGQISKYETVNMEEQATRAELGFSVTRLLEQTRAAMGVAGRQAAFTSLDPASAARAKERDLSAKANREIDDVVMDHLVLTLENQKLDDAKTMLEGDKAFLDDIKGTPLQQQLDQARRQCRDVREWLTDLLESVIHMRCDQVNTMLHATTSWQQVKSWTSDALVSEFGIEDAAVRSNLLKRISETLNPEKLLQQLHSLVIAPISSAMGVGQDVLIIPHGVLFGVPWAALMDPAGHFLVEKHAIRIAPSLRVAAAAATPRVHQQRCTANHAVENRTVHRACVCDKCAHQSASRGCRLADSGGKYFYCNRCRVDMCTLWCKAEPDVRKAVVIGNPSPNSCGPLPFAEAEADKTCSALQQSEIFDAVKIATTSRATKSWALQNLDQASWVHLACHGKLETNSLVLARDADGQEELSLLELQSQVTLRSGSTVVLSACNTGMGQMCGEGVVGLARGVLAAGGGSAVVSLWSISDESTKALMAHMYSFLLADLDVPQAMRHAMLRMLGREPLEQVESQHSRSSAPDSAASREREDDAPETEGGCAVRAEACLRSFTNKQGKAELAALSVLFADGRGFLVDGRPLAVGNGLDERGMMTKDCCRLLFDVVSYPQVWSERGPALRRAAAIGVEPLKLVLLHVKTAISIRVEARGRFGSDGGHDYMLQRLRGAKAELDNLLRESDSRPKARLRGGGPLELGQTWSSTFSQPKYWASFVVTGARTKLPCPLFATASPETPADTSQPAESAASLAVPHPSASASTVAGSLKTEASLSTQVFLVLSLEMVCDRLRDIGLAQYCEAFAENSIDGSMLDELENLWDELGVEKKAHRIKILKAFGLRG